MFIKKMLDPKVIFFMLIIAGVLFEIGGDVFFKKWALENRTWLLILGLGIYFIGAYFWAISLKYEGLAKAVTIFTLLNLIIASLIGIFYFKEDLSIINKIGIAIGIISVLLIEM